MGTWNEGLLSRVHSGDTGIGPRILQTVRHVRIGGRGTVQITILKVQLLQTLIDINHGKDIIRACQALHGHIKR